MMIEVSLYVVVAPLTACFFIAYAWNHVMRGEKTFWEALLWTLFWGGICTVVLFPEWMDVITGWTGIKDRENAVFAIVLGVILFVIFHMLVRMEKLEKRITDVVRTEALHEAGLSDSPHEDHSSH